ncbi:carbonyl reductase [NADPH] 3-like [Dreissena polymorpha]|uniref:carbonyl reductase [NADPH] 3-like n=1 Tax=Dreissena polymorpha TaxID=45954 RepID=UPI0022647782|nr:carbonyl reductase [NADPH] 3-like [Dreissena polymorpha]
MSAAWVCSVTDFTTVTGSNKGIGYAIVRGLCKQFPGDVILTARSEENGRESVKKLNEEGLKPLFHQLDITDDASVRRMRDFLQMNYGGLDVLVNNAAIAYKMAAKEPFSKQVEVTMATNFCGTLNVCRVLFPLLRPHARVVHLSSRSGSFTAARCSKALQTRFLDPELSMLKIEQLMNEFVESAKADIHKTNGWHDSAYGTTKIGVTLMTYVQQREFSADSRPDIVVNSCCPGFVVTDLTSQRGTKTIDEGADTPLYLAMLPANTTSPKGQFVCEREIKTML